MDVSAYATEYARRELGLDVFTGTIEQLERPPESVDLVTMLLTIEHLPDPKGVLQAAHRLLRPGGVLIIATHDVEGLWPRVVGARWRHFNVPEHVYYFSRRTLTRLLSDVGFETFKVAETPTLAAVTESDDTETGLYAPIRFLHKTRLHSPERRRSGPCMGSRAGWTCRTASRPTRGRYERAGGEGARAPTRLRRVPSLSLPLRGRGLSRPLSVSPQRLEPSPRRRGFSVDG